MRRHPHVRSTRTGSDQVPASPTRRAYLREFADRFSRDITSTLTTQTVIVAKVLVFGWSTLDLLWLVTTALMMLVVHVRTLRVHRELRAELDAAAHRESLLQAELTDAKTDHLTGLSTRRFIYRHLNDTAAETDLTVAFVDVDGLKAINDRLGHGAGDDHLAAIAGRLSAASIPGDVLGRLGGDEFVLATARMPDQVAAALTSALHAPTVIAGELMPLRVSVGIVRTAGGDAHTALSCAEAAMRTAKRRRSFIEQYRADRDGIPLPRGVRPAIRPRDQQPDIAP
jgi:diguanylate cyclase (GGDEF)-like protein